MALNSSVLRARRVPSVGGARAALSPLVLPVKPRQTYALKASASPSSTSTPAATNQLIESLDALLAAKQSGAPQEEIESLISTVKQLSSQAGADRVIPELNDGVFKGFTLTGRMTKLLGGDSTITMQVLSFGLYKPNDLLVRPIGGDAAQVFKGERFGRSNTYVISTPIRLEEAGVEGVSHAIATYHPVADNPQRLDVQFAALRLEPSSTNCEDLAKWISALAEANPGMDAATGVLEVAIPEGAMPKGWMDYHAMTDGYQLVTGNGGSTTLLKRTG